MSKIVLKKRKNPFVIMSKTALQDKTLSWKAKGMIAYLLSLPDDWQVYVNELKNRSKDSRDSTRTALNELIKANYVYRKALKKVNGQFAGFEYYIYEEPTMQEPKTDNPISGNAELLNKEVTKEKDTKELFNSMGENNFDNSNFSKNQIIDGIVLEMKEREKKEKSCAKKEILSSDVLVQLTKFNNHMKSKKGKRWYTSELKAEQIDYIRNLKKSYSDNQIINSIKEAIRNSFITFSPEYSINRQKNQKNNEKSDNDIYTNFTSSLNEPNH